jgi:predicted hydrocarbon binding protein
LIQQKGKIDMDLETAKKLNEVLIPLGYTVGRIVYETKNYELAIQMCNINQEYQIGIDIGKELTKVLHAGIEDIPPWEPPNFKGILKRYGIENYIDSSFL